MTLESEANCFESRNSEGENSEEDDETRQKLEMKGCYSWEIGNGRSQNQRSGSMSQMS